MTQARSVTATFTINTYTLTVTNPGVGGRITSSDGFISCGNGAVSCSKTYNSGVTVTLNTTPAAGYTNGTWGGNCTGSSANPCSLTMNAAKSVSATFTLNTYSLAITSPGATGNISGGTAGHPINCGNGGSDCSGTYTSGTAFSLTATPASGYSAGTWGGNCTGSSANPCSLTMNAAKSVSATFTLSNQPPSANNLLVTQPDYCIITWPAAIFSWQFTDPDNDTQSAYQIQVDNNNNFSSPEVDTGKILSSSISYATLSGALSWNTTYYWQLKVWDSKDLSSSWISGSSFNIPRHQYPTINFTWTPQSPTTNENVQFTDQSFVYGGSTKSSWSWTFQDANPSNSALQNPIVKFLSAGNKSVILRVTDSDGFSCQVPQKTVNSQLPLPEWQEIPPF